MISFVRLFVQLRFNFIIFGIANNSSKAIKIYLSQIDCIINKMQCHANSFARIKYDFTLRDGYKSLINNISYTKQSNVLWHFFKDAKLFVKAFWDNTVSL